MMPTDEQLLALDSFKKLQSLKINAYAGTGKTSTLNLLAKSSSRVGHYLAFNKSIAAEAKSKFPNVVTCSTTHSVAYRSIRAQCDYSNKKLTQTPNANLVAQALSLPADTRCSDEITLSRQSYAGLIRDACRRFLQSSDDQPEARHFPRYGRLDGIRDQQFVEFTRHALPHLQDLWKFMVDPNGWMPLGHDGYLKLWALTRPKLLVDYVMLDEAQDANPVMLGVLSQQDCQVVYVGDPYQQIYEWRGAVNAMQQVRTANQTLLSRSFRFGQGIADGASRVIAKIGAVKPLRGTPEVTSHISKVHPDTVLCRTNASVISNVMQHLSQGLRCHVVGGTAELQRLLEDVSRLKRGIPSELPDFFGFKNWNEVLAYSSEPEGEHLKTFVKLVSDFGEERILAAIRNCEADERTAQVNFSTAHKAKGREWDHVRVDRDFDSAFQRLMQPGAMLPVNKNNFEAEARLFYVAMTRGKRAVELPPGTMDIFGLQETCSEVNGQPKLKATNARNSTPTRAAAVGSRNDSQSGLWGLLRKILG